MNLSAPPIRTPFLNKDGTMSQPWVKWLQLTQAIVNTSFGTIVDVTQANLPSLTSASTGALYYVTDYHHLLQWDGQSWQWAPGENGSGYVANFPQGVNPGVGWHTCDGSLQNRLKSDGTLQQVPLPLMGQAGSFGNLTAYFRQ